MLAQRREHALIDAEDMLDQARYEGEHKGRQKGLQEGAVVIFETLLPKKFGLLPEWVRSRIDIANEVTLSQWAIRVLDAKNVEDVFAVS